MKVQNRYQEVIHTRNTTLEARLKLVRFLSSIGDTVSNISYVGILEDYPQQLHVHRVSNKGVGHLWCGCNSETPTTITIDEFIYKYNDLSHKPTTPNAPKTKFNYQASPKSNKSWSRLVGTFKKHRTWYITVNIANSDLVLRYYFRFQDRPNYEGKWFIKNPQKEYLEVPETFAKHVYRTMTGSEEFVEVCGRIVKGAYIKVQL